MDPLIIALIAVIGASGVIYAVLPKGNVPQKAERIDDTGVDPAERIALPFDATAERIAVPSDTTAVRTPHPPYPPEARVSSVQPNDSHYDATPVPEATEANGGSRRRKRRQAKRRQTKRRQTKRSKRQRYL